MEGESRLKKLGTLGGSISVNKKNMWIYGNTPHMTKEVLFGKAGQGSLHPGMPYEHQLAVSAVHSDTRKTLIRELVDQTHLTREEAERTVNDLVQQGLLEEIDDPGLGKVLVFKEGKWTR